MSLAPKARHGREDAVLGFRDVCRVVPADATGGVTICAP
jgi:hypothetical protein